MRVLASCFGVCLLVLLVQLTGEVMLQHRIKSPYSMWKKMEKKKVNYKLASLLYPAVA